MEVVNPVANVAYWNLMAEVVTYPIGIGDQIHEKV